MDHEPDRQPIDLAGADPPGDREASDGPAGDAGDAHPRHVRLVAAAVPYSETCSRRPRTTTIEVSTPWL
jgi:hypothetical protein